MDANVGRLNILYNTWAVKLVFILMLTVHSFQGNIDCLSVKPSIHLKEEEHLGHKMQRSFQVLAEKDNLMTTVAKVP